MLAVRSKSPIERNYSLDGSVLIRLPAVAATTVWCWDVDVALVLGYCLALRDWLG